MSNPKKQNLIKILLLGESNVGKTTIFQRFCLNTVDKNAISTIGVEFKVKNYKYNNKDYQIQLFDTAGQERFKSITEAYYRMGDAFFFVFDLTNQDSLNVLDDWINKVNETIENPLYIIIGNKDDLKEQIPKESIENFINKYKDKNIPFIKTSALKNKNIDKAFETIIDIFEKNPTKMSYVERKITITKNKKDKTKICC